MILNSVWYVYISNDCQSGKVSDTETYVQLSSVCKKNFTLAICRLSFPKPRLIFLQVLLKNFHQVPLRKSVGASAQMSKFKLAIKLLYGRYQTITSLGGGFPIMITYVKKAILRMNTSKSTSFIVFASSLQRGSVYQQERGGVLSLIGQLWQ